MYFETYEMIKPERNSLSEYEYFYSTYGQTVKMNLILNQMLKEIKERIPLYFLEIMQNIETLNDELNVNLLLIGLQKNEGRRKDYLKSISNDDNILIDKFFSSDIELYIDYYSNYQLVIMLYALFESTITSYINRKSNLQLQIRQKDLLTKLCKIIGGDAFVIKFKKSCNCAINLSEMKTIWNYYTNIRNLYSHSGGIISKEFINKMNRYKDDLENFKKKRGRDLACSLFEIPNNDFFQIDNLVIGNLFIINEFNFRFFRHFLIYLWETVYLLEYNLKPVDKLNNFTLVSNNLRFELYDDPDDQDLIQTMPEILTSNIEHFHINGYKCPKCKKHSSFLYKATPGKDIDISEIVNNIPDAKYKSRKIFTCPNCKSFFFSSYGGSLRDNGGFNILDLDDYGYNYLLNKFNNICIK